MTRWFRGLFYRAAHHRPRRFLVGPTLQDIWEAGPPPVGSMNLADERRARGWLS